MSTILVTGGTRGIGLAGLVNSAGVIRRTDEFDPDVFADVVDTNLLGTMRTITACRPALAAGGGSVVNVASILSLFGSGFAPAYSTSKGGIAQLTRSLAVAFADDGIRVNAVLPGWFRTDMTAALRDQPEREADILGRTPMGRWGDPEELVGPVAGSLGRQAGGSGRPGVRWPSAVHSTGKWASSITSSSGRAYRL